MLFISQFTPNSVLIYPHQNAYNSSHKRRAELNSRPRSVQLTHVFSSNLDRSFIRDPNKGSTTGIRGQKLLCNRVYYRLEAG
jgi:hypothetical protein